MPKLTKTDLIKTVLNKKIEVENGADPEFICKKCGLSWKARWDEAGEFLTQSYLCPNGCNRMEVSI